MIALETIGRFVVKFIKVVCNIFSTVLHSSKNSTNITVVVITGIGINLLLKYFPTLSFGYLALPFDVRCLLLDINPTV